jgi:hypothetical protein
MFCETEAFSAMTSLKSKQIHSFPFWSKRKAALHCCKAAMYIEHPRYEAFKIMLYINHQTSGNWIYILDKQDFHKPHIPEECA